MGNPKWLPDGETCPINEVRSAGYQVLYGHRYATGKLKRGWFSSNRTHCRLCGRSVCKECCGKPHHVSTGKLSSAKKCCVECYKFWEETQSRWKAHLYEKNKQFPRELVAPTPPPRLNNNSGDATSYHSRSTSNSTADQPATAAGTALPIVAGQPTRGRLASLAIPIQTTGTGLI